MESPALNPMPPWGAPISHCGLLFSGSERSAVRRISFLTLVVHLPSAVASLVQTKSQRVSPDCDIWDELSGKVDAPLIHSQCALSQCALRVASNDALADAFQRPIFLEGSRG